MGDKQGFGDGDRFTVDLFTGGYAATTPVLVKIPCLGLGVGRGLAKARTGGELPKSCEVSHETTPRLTPNSSLCEGVFLN